MTSAALTEARAKLTDLTTPKLAPITSGVELPEGSSRIFFMIEEQRQRDERERRRLVRLLINRDCADTGNLGAMDYGPDDPERSL